MSSSTGARSGLRLVFVILALSTAALFVLPHEPGRDLANAAIVEMLPAAAAANVLLAIAGWRLNAVTAGGALTGAAIGTTIALGSGWGAWWVLVVMFAVVVATTRAGQARKTSLGIDEPHRGRRGPGNAIANAGLAAGAASVHLMTGSDLAQVWAIASLVTSGSDTVASEIGKAYGNPTWHLLQWRRVPPGTTGGISAAGTVAGALSAAALTALAITLQIVDAVAGTGIILAATIAGIVEGVVAGPLESGRVVDNDGINLLGGAIGAAVAVAWVLALSN